jgi:hypothetical protein
MNGKWWILATVVILESVEIELLLNRQKRRLIATLLYVQDKNRAFAKLPLRVFSLGLNHSSESRAPQLQWSGTVLELFTSILSRRLALSSAHCGFRSPIDA